MTDCWAVIPVKASPGNKSRLAGVLDSAEREALTRAMLAQVYAAAKDAANIAGVMLVGSSHQGLPDAVPLLADPGGGLNAAVQSALLAISARNAGRLVVVAGDLPLVTAQDIALLAAAPESTIAIAPDRHGTGTNALSLPLPEAQGFSFAFGPDSFARHSAEAARLGLRLEVIHSRGLACDVDEPADLPDAQTLLGAA